MMRKFHVGLLGLLLLALCGFAMSQTATTGQIAGTVADPTGAVVSGAKIILTSDAGVKRELTSDATGHYAFPLLPPGKYSLEISSSGFAPAKIQLIDVRITTTSIVDVPLRLAAAQAESVEVTAQPPLVNADSATAGRVIEQNTIRQLPLPTRNFQQLLTLTPGASGSLANSSELGRGDASISVNGNRSTSNLVVINGIDANSIGTNSTPNLAVPATDTLQEFIVQTSLYDATQGRASGGIVAAVTKSGTNQFHGNAYEFYRNDVLNANNYFLNKASIKKPVYERNQFGATLGGPISKDRAWFFLSYQGTRETNGTSLTNSLSTVFTPGNLTDDRSDAALNTLAQSMGLAGLASISPQSLAIMRLKLPNGQYFVPSSPVNTGNATPVATPITSTSKFREDQLNGNIDYNVSTANHLAVKFFWANNPTTQALYNLFGTGNALQAPGNPTNVDLRNRVISIGDTHVISPSMINDLRFGVNWIKGITLPDEPFTASDFLMSTPLQSLYPGAPLIGITNLMDLGASPLADNISDVRSWTWADTLTWSKGRHNLKFGGEFKYHQSNLVFNAYTRGQLVFSNFASFLQGRAASSIIGSGVPDRQNSANDFALFFQDDWRVSNRFTLNLGIRYDVYGQFSEEEGRYVAFDPALATKVAIPAAAGGGYAITGGFVQAGNGSLPNIPKVQNGLVDTDWNNFGPRIGFAWKPLDTNSLVVRGGYGMYFDRPSARLLNSQVFASPYYSIAIAGGNAALWPNIASPFFKVPTPDKYPLNFGDATKFPFGGPPLFAPVDYIFGIPLTLTAAVPSTGVYPDRHNFRTPYVQQFNLGAQWEFQPNFLLDVSYVGSAGTKLYRLRGLNALSTPLQSITTTPYYPGLSPYSNAIFGTYVFQSSARSNYNSLQTSLTKRYSNGLQFLASYTWSHSIDNYSGGDTNDLVGLPAEQATSDYFASSDFDRRHRLVVSFVYDLPKFYKGGNRFANGMFNDWELAGIGTWQSGVPFSVVGYSVGIVTSSWADLASGRTIESATKTGDVSERLDAYFDKTAFTLPATGWGNAGRNILRGPDQRNLDLSIVKFFKIRESQKFEFRTEFFNVFNTVNFANPVNVFTSANFGQVVRTTTGPRVIQFGMKYSF